MSQAASHAARLEDLRSTLAAQASRAEQRNRPRALLLIACIVLVVGAWVAWSGYSASAQAAERAGAAQRYSDSVLKAAGKLQSLQASGDVQASEPMSQLFSRIEALGGVSGLKSRVPIGASQTRPERALGWNQVKTTYTIRDPELSAVLRWVDAVVAEIPGMEVHSITVRPETTDWSVTVVFSRWEKAEGGT
jgi:hypothetical protein